MRASMRDIVNAHINRFKSLVRSGEIRRSRKEDFSRRRGIVASGNEFFTYYTRLKLGPFDSKDKAITALAIEITTKHFIKFRSRRVGNYEPPIRVCCDFNNTVDRAVVRLKRLYGDELRTKGGGLG